MSKKRKNQQRRIRERDEAWRDFMATIEGLDLEDLKPGMSQVEVSELLSIATAKMSERMTRDGLANRVPWGMTYSPESLVRTAQTGLLMMRSGDRGIDGRGDAEDLGDDESFRMIFETISGCLTMAAASVLYLFSLPIPFELARHMQTGSVDADGKKQP